MDTLQNLKAFLAVAGSGSFSAAARRLGVAPSVVTKRIDQLEWAAKVALFARSTRRVAPTEAGERFLPRVRAGTLGHAVLASSAMIFYATGFVSLL